ncbi:heterokaryon incompatibility protein-domain-containing protein [Suillus placidus]|uniref:Heterokaryon incompatibility protein-domain-containing protein n=1 Tax=Suillus placidus TaxID=48579 RepID=A0A9P7D2G1_9AGAM|nr:heterokaryon incompatibility protein-domain-containing protein [Suillus placidus]
MSSLLYPGLIEEDEQRDHTPTLDNDALLCSICANLDLYQFFRDGVPERDQEIPLGSLSSILEKSYQCNFCRLISFHVRQTRMLDEFPHVDRSGIECKLSSRKSGVLWTYFPISERFSCYHLNIHVKGLRSLSIHLMQEDAFKFGRPTDFDGRRVKNTVDVGLVKKWIKVCQASHRYECGNIWATDNVDRKLPRFVRVVDVVSMAVIPAPSGCRYVALSYVWGGIGAEYWTTKDNIVERSTPGGLNTANLPETITDSILFVRHLGERYIWIDALCIIQDDSQDKFSQIHTMDLVYGLSYLTIIAAGGTTARDPLPGYRPRTRTLQQHIEVVQGLHLYAALPRLDEALALSTWNTRCWTYQEQVLSRRRIYFTEQQVYFECRRSVFCEDIVAESMRHKISNFLRESSGGYFRPRADPFVIGDMLQSYCFGHYKHAVERCTRRNLTIESDIVDAFTGVTNALAVGVGLGDPARAFQYGMILTDLHRALLWQHDPHIPHARRSLPDGNSPPLPSWTWAAWRGAIDYMTEGRYKHINNIASATSVVETFVDPWYIVDHSNAPVRLDVPREKLPIFSPVIRKSPYLPPSGILDPTELILDIHRPLEPGTLIFRTTSSHFDIASRARGGEETRARVRHNVFDILSPASSPPTWAGTVILPVDHALPTSLEFIVLSRADMHEESCAFYPGCMLHVMAIRSQNEGLVERVGLGVIHEVVWVASSPKEKIVFLR